jgi:hypothetical protein
MLILPVEGLVESGGPWGSMKVFTFGFGRQETLGYITVKEFGGVVVRFRILEEKGAVEKVVVFNIFGHVM